MSNNRKSWVWMYAKLTVICVPNMKTMNLGGTNEEDGKRKSGSLGRHLITIHRIKPSATETRRYVLNINILYYINIPQITTIRELSHQSL